MTRFTWAAGPPAPCGPSSRAMKRCSGRAGFAERREPQRAVPQSANSAVRAVASGVCVACSIIVRSRKGAGQVSSSGGARSIPKVFGCLGVSSVNPVATASVETLRPAISGCLVLHLGACSRRGLRCGCQRKGAPPCSNICCCQPTAPKLLRPRCSEGFNWPRIARPGSPASVSCRNSMCSASTPRW